MFRSPRVGEQFYAIFTRISKSQHAFFWQSRFLLSLSMPTFLYIDIVCLLSFFSLSHILHFHYIPVRSMWTTGEHSHTFHLQKKTQRAKRKQCLNLLQKHHHVFKTHYKLTASNFVLWSDALKCNVFVEITDTAIPRFGRRGTFLCV